MTNVYFLRHGEMDWNLEGRTQGRTDIPLNRNGELQAKESGAALKDKKIDLIITSPLKRAKKTAEIVQEQLNVDLIEREAFIELSFGDAEGMTLAEKLERFPDRIYPNSEDGASIERRFLTGLAEIHDKYHNQNVVVVSHGAFINAILYHYSNGETGTGKIKLANGGITSLKISDDKVEILECNQVNHLSQYKKIGEL
ncbi:histidine phosphatase family protein [Mammaliicoccus sciuri]|uniref:histidine phosphatase family protein n=1 Tax=Mammaliicoccus sciuri TaxID=1296 RepID=UPI003F54D189